ncbi:hypothetical protein TCAL_02585 [Tigriopus californicus]|uniref:C2H2-type domain-containing protein n=1 Tax=Tigriopus californicus TaxID=6832 RepID=A0A553P8T4_TIGCA|nr:zinc finger protein 90-like [Tigriopus californicus]TRY74092.1 hypothetical protein TCAL_02585 [Tigriopus californicus]|eukprot:TCALIF_02585-PA protein Name:"Similar to ZNF311 Zinc finger protein 311 (Homo sapiens)" AED:0.01 eAED:0.01 QI:76/1/1/1/1/1/2/58/712
MDSSAQNSLDWTQLSLSSDLQVLNFDPWKVITRRALDFSPHAHTPNIAMMVFVNARSLVYSLQVLHRTYREGQIQSEPELRLLVEEFFYQQTPCYGYAQNPDLPLAFGHQFADQCQVLVNPNTNICPICQDQGKNEASGLILEDEESKPSVLEEAFQANQINVEVEDILLEDRGSSPDLFDETESIAMDTENDKDAIDTEGQEIKEESTESKDNLPSRRSSRRLQNVPMNYTHLLNGEEEDLDDKVLAKIPRYIGEEEEEKDYTPGTHSDSEDENVGGLSRGPYRSYFPKRYDIKPVSEDDPRVICPICNRFFKNAKTLRSHINFHNNQHRTSAPRPKKPSKHPKLFCSHCDAQFRLPKALANHLIKDHNASEDELKKIEVKELQCWICSRTFTNRNVHEQHKKKEHLLGKWQCLFCDDMPRHGLEVFEHYKANHRRSNYKINCVLCDEKVCFSEGYEALESHWKICYNRRVMERMAVQKAKQKNSERIKHICDQCGRMFSLRSTLLEHQDEHKGIFKHCCTECNYRTAFKHRLTLHCRVRHSPDGKRVRQRNYVPCEICGKIVNDASLPSHNARAHSEPTWPCDQCDKAFGTNWLLNKHLKSTHPTTSVKCEICGLFLKSKGTLRSHMLTHAPAKFSCRFCGKGLKTRLSLGNHERIHTKENPYKCDQCQFACATSGNLLLHKKRKHDVQKKNFYIPALIPDEETSSAPPE